MADHKYRADVIVVSDSRSQNLSQDESGSLLVHKLEKFGKFSSIHKFTVEDDREKIKSRVSTSVMEDCALIITTGGTGLCPRDVTPEATRDLYEKECPGITTALIRASLECSPHAALSRLTAGIVGQCLIVNFPGRPRACEECFTCLAGFLGHALDQVRFDPEAVKATHLKQDSEVKNHVPEVTKHQNRQGNPQEIQDYSHQDRADQVTDTQACPNHTTVTSDGKVIVESSYPLESYENVIKILKEASTSFKLGVEDLPICSQDNIADLLGRVVAEDMPSKNSIPPHSVSTMDGYVLNLSARMAKILPSIGRVIAHIVDGYEHFQKRQNGPISSESDSFFCYQVNTGGRLPDKNFVVIPFEDTGPGPTNRNIVIYKIQPNKFIRKPGTDIDLADTIERGAVITPIEVSLMITMGYRSVAVLKRPLVGILSTGDELVDYIRTIEGDSDKVYDINRPLLVSMLRQKGHHVIDCGIVRDSSIEVLLKVLESISKCDILVVTGGASMGSKDYVKRVIEKSMGGKFHFGRVNIKPGKPAAFGSIESGDKKKFVFSLPGNPVSAYITSLVLLMPFIGYIGYSQLGRDLPSPYEMIGTSITVEIESIVDSEGDQHYSLDGRLEFVRGRFSRSRKSLDRAMNQPYPVTVSIRQQSSRLLSLKGIDCLIVVDPNLKYSSLLVGQTFQALRLNH